MIQNNKASGLKKFMKSHLIRHPFAYEVALRIFNRPISSDVGVFRKLISKGDVVFDIGANAGQFSCLFSCLVGHKGEVHVFEPVKNSFDRLKNNISAFSPPSKIYFNNIALGDNEGLVKMFVPSSDYTRASFKKHDDPECGTQIGDMQFDVVDKVKCDTIDNYISQNGIKRVAFIKCDVEGAELLVMKGAKALFKSKRPPVIFLELFEKWTKDFGYVPIQLFNYLNELAGYQFIYLGREGPRQVDLSSTLPVGEFPDYLNYLCYLPDIHKDSIQYLF